MNPVLSQTGLNELKRALAVHARILIVSHVDPDGDTVGSAMGLAWALRAKGLHVRLACQDPMPDEVGFLPGIDEYTADGPAGEGLIIAVDASDRRRMGEAFAEGRLDGRTLAVIDHHVTNQGFGDINLIADAPATAMLMIEVIDDLGIPLDAKIATYLLTGIVSDTQGFRTSNTTPECLAAAQRLMQAGALLTEVCEGVFSRRRAALLPLWGAALSGAVLSNGVLWAEIPAPLASQDGLGGKVTSGLANFLNTVREAQVAVILAEQANGIIDTSLRSKPGIDISGIAQAFGGGGHPQAAGCQVAGSLAEVRERIVAAIQAALAHEA